jgi:hypothetical protein
MVAIAESPGNRHFGDLALGSTAGFPALFLPEFGPSYLEVGVLPALNLRSWRVESAEGELSWRNGCKQVIIAT